MDGSSHGGNGSGCYDSVGNQPGLGDKTLGLQTSENNPMEGPSNTGEEIPMMEEAVEGDAGSK